MAVVVFEKWKSRAGKASVEDPSITIVYGVKGTTDETLVDAAIEATSPTTWNNLTRQSWQRECLGPTDDGGLWEVTVLYDRNEPKGTGVVQFSCDTSGGHEKITQSKETVFSVGVTDTDGSIPRNAPDCQGCIGVTDTSIEGVDVTIPKMEITVVSVIADADLPADYIENLRNAVGTTNDDFFTITYKSQVLEFDEQELLYLGGPINYRGNGDWEFHHKFSFQNTVNNLHLGRRPTSGSPPDLSGEIIIPIKRGWEYLWLYYKEQKDSNTGFLVRKLQGGFVEKVYDVTAFPTLFLPAVL